ncbi:MAG: NUDIX domain-containing protein [Bacteroidaceae bacterium]|nr:NUDIX domain-containing protein [Bacteroidaceae bacterium]
MEHPLHKFKFCPQCGGHFVDNDFKSKRCEACGFVLYLNPAASTAAFIVDDGKLLVVERAKEPAKGTFDLPGGFVDCYETAEQGVEREIKEELGLAIKSKKYIFSNSNRYVYSGFTVHTLDMFFECALENYSEIRPMDDVATYRWIPLSEVNPADFGLESISQGVERYLKEKCF